MLNSIKQNKWCWVLGAVVVLGLGWWVTGCGDNQELIGPIPPEVNGSMDFDTSGNTINGEGYFVAEGTGRVDTRGEGHALIRLRNDSGVVIWNDETADMINHHGNFYHIASEDDTVTVITIDGEGEVALQGAGTVWFSGTGWQFAYKD
tara:strand:+ start:285 stop:728 length:444 start_codon:yes stop_codon:yes gene_type:complete